MLALSQAQVGSRETIKWNCCNFANGVLESEYGMASGAEIEVIGSFFGNVVVRVGDVVLALTKDLADKVKI